MALSRKSTWPSSLRAKSTKPGNGRTGAANDVAPAPPFFENEVRCLKAFHTLLDAVEKVLCVLLGVMMIALTADIVLQVVARYCFSAPPPYTEELARRILCIVVYCGAAVAYRKREMMGITFIQDRVPAAARKVIIVLIDALIGAFGIFLLYVGWKMCLHISGQLSPALQLPKSLFMAFIPFFGVLTTVFALEKILDTLCAGRKPDDEKEGAPV